MKKKGIKLTFIRSILTKSETYLNDTDQMTKKGIFKRISFPPLLAQGVKFQSAQIFVGVDPLVK